ncbi:MAG: hypothetical protein ACAI35_11610 [Candidatus Methylacidiphilales bacterium]
MVAKEEFTSTQIEAGVYIPIEYAMLSMKVITIAMLLLAASICPAFCADDKPLSEMLNDEKKPRKIGAIEISGLKAKVLKEGNTAGGILSTIGFEVTLTNTSSRDSDSLQIFFIFLDGEDPMKATTKQVLAVETGIGPITKNQGRVLKSTTKMTPEKWATVKSYDIRIKNGTAEYQRSLRGH